jgi:hypothetical protein
MYVIRGIMAEHLKIFSWLGIFKNKLKYFYFNSIYYVVVKHVPLN